MRDLSIACQYCFLPILGFEHCVVWFSLHFGAIIQGESLDDGIILFVGRAIRHLAGFGDGVIHRCSRYMRHFPYW